MKSQLFLSKFLVYILVNILATLFSHAHMMTLIPPKYAVAQIIDFIKGKSAIQLSNFRLGSCITS
jgi:REP element-mobilizing transposase RayT